MTSKSIKEWHQIKKKIATSDNDIKLSHQSITSNHDINHEVNAGKKKLWQQSSHQIMKSNNHTKWLQQTTTSMNAIKSLQQCRYQGWYQMISAKCWHQRLTSKWWHQFFSIMTSNQEKDVDVNYHIKQQIMTSMNDHESQ